MSREVVIQGLSLLQFYLLAIGPAVIIHIATQKASGNPVRNRSALILCDLIPELQ